jgi:hypothetical protein
MERQSLLPLLESVVRDNPTYKFPIETINKELVSLFMNPLEFDYFTIQSYRKLKREFGDTLAHIFLSTLELKLNLKDRDIYKLSTQEYQAEIENFITTMENLYITKVNKKSSDGEMMSAMA